MPLAQDTPRITRPTGLKRRRGAPAAALAALLLALAPAPSQSSTNTPQGATTITAIEVKKEAVRLQVRLTLTRAVSYRISQPDPQRLVVDVERANFDFAHPVDLKADGGWVTDWGYGFLMFGYTRVSVHFDRAVAVAHDAMQAEAEDRPARLTIDLIEAP